jgi:hypothetical protein
MKARLHVKTLILSDIHLGIADSKAIQAAHLIRNCDCEKIILNGDIIDAWALKGSGKWTSDHTHFIRTVLKKMEKEQTEVIRLLPPHRPQTQGPGDSHRDAHPGGTGPVARASQVPITPPPRTGRGSGWPNVKKSKQSGP